MIGCWLLLTAILTQANADVVLLKSGERLEGVIVEASPSAGVRLRRPDGTVRWIHPMAVDRIERAGEPPPPAPPAAPPAADPPAASPPEPTAAEPPAASPVEAPSAPPRPRFAPPGGWMPAPPAPTGPPHGQGWLSFALGTSNPFGGTGQDEPSLEALVGGEHLLLSFEAGLRMDERSSFGAVLDLSVGEVGAALQPICSGYGADCSTATAQLGLFYRRDFAPLARLNPWGSLGVGREWLAGEVFAPSGGGDPVEVLSARGWQARLGAGIDWRLSPVLGLGLYATVALGRYEDFSVDGADRSGGMAIHGWAQTGLRAILGP